MALIDVLGGAAGYLGRTLGGFGGAARGKAETAWDSFANQRGLSGHALPGLGSSSPGYGFERSVSSGYGFSGGGNLGHGLAWGGDTGDYGFGGGAAPDHGFDVAQIRRSGQAAWDANKPPEPTVAPQGGNYGQPAVATNAGGLGSSAWADKINQYAARYADAPELAEVAQAVIELESNGDPNAQGVVVTQGSYAGQRAQGLGQIMPGNYPGVNLLDPDTNIRLMQDMLYERYKRYGNWESAVAAYFGAIDAQGRPTTQKDDNQTSGIEYVAIVNRHRATIRAARAPAPVSGAGGASSLSSIWGNTNAKTSQGYGVVTPGIDQRIYAYGRDFGLAQGHPGIDIAAPRGTALYMPAGMGGTVTIAGGTPYFLDEDYGDKGTPGKGELRIQLDNGDQIIFGHTSAISVRQGQRVNGGQLMAAIGSANGDHLHLEVRVRQPNGSYLLVNPEVYFAQKGAPPGVGVAPGHYVGDGHPH